MNVATERNKNHIQHREGRRRKRERRRTGDENRQREREREGGGGGVGGGGGGDRERERNLTNFTRMLNKQTSGTAQLYTLTELQSHLFAVYLKTESFD